MTISAPRLTRHVTLEGPANVRDLGGHRARAGQMVRWRRVLRADTLDAATGGDLAVLGDLGVRTVIDLRTVTEYTQRPHPHEDDPLVTYFRFPLLARTWAEDGQRPEGDTAAFLADRYLEMLVRGAPALAAALDVLSDPLAHPVVVHCTAGKDRTGVVAAVLLGLLGVADEAIAEDYAASGPAVASLVQRRSAGDPVTAATLASRPAGYLEAPPEAMLRFLEQVRHRHGTMVGYARGIGVPLETIERLHEVLLG
jgi:protein tyrosine/serine phosphatase